MAHRSLTFAAAALAFGACTVAGAADAEALGDLAPTPAAVNALDRAAGYDVVTLVAPIAHQAGTPLLLEVPLPGGAVTLDLQPYDVRSLDFDVFVQDADGIRLVDAPAPRTLRGTVAGAPDSAALGSFVDGRFTGLYRLTADAPWMVVQPFDDFDAAAPADAHIVIDTSLVAHHGHTCGVTDDFMAEQFMARLDDPTFLPPAAAEAAPAGGGATGSADGDAATCCPGCASTAEAAAAKRPEPKPGTITASPAGFFDDVADIVIDADFQFFLESGGSIPGVVSDIENVMNTVAFVYERDIDITYEITGILIRTTSGDNPYTTSDPEGLLCQFLSEWNTSPLSTVRRDVAHLFTGRNLIGTTIGIAFNGVVCNVSAGSACPGGVQNLAYGLSESNFSPIFDERVSLTAHELGHNWNANHCTGSTCHIMCATTGGCGGTVGGNLKFGPVSISAISAFRNTRACLSDDVAPLTPPLEETWPSTIIDDDVWPWFIESAVTDAAPSPPSGPFSLELRSLNGFPLRQGDIRSAEILLEGESGFFLQFEYGYSDVEAGETMTVEWRTDAGQWAPFITLISTGGDADFAPVILPLPAPAYHDAFRLRFRVDTDQLNDRWYVDDISVGPLVVDPPCLGDFDDSGDVGFADLVTLLSLWGDCPAPCDADFDENGSVDFNDLVTLLSAWGPCP